MVEMGAEKPLAHSAATTGAAEEFPRLTQAEIDARLEAIGYRLEVHNAHLVRRAHQRATAIFQKMFDGKAITPTQTAILATLARHGEMSQINLGRLTAIDTATLSPMMRRLQAMGLIERIATEQDQRVNLARLTPKGIHFTLEILPISNQVSDEVLAPLAPRDRKKFIELLTQIG